MHPFGPFDLRSSACQTHARTSKVQHLSPSPTSTAAAQDIRWSTAPRDFVRYSSLQRAGASLRPSRSFSKLAKSGATPTPKFVPLGGLEFHPHSTASAPDHYDLHDIMLASGRHSRRNEVQAATTQTPRPTPNEQQRAEALIFGTGPPQFIITESNCVELVGGHVLRGTLSALGFVSCDLVHCAKSANIGQG